VLVRNGSLRVGQYFVCGLQMGRIRSLLDERDRAVSEVHPGESAQLFGLRGLEDLTEDLYVVESEEVAERIVEERRELLEADESDFLLEEQHNMQVDQKVNQVIKIAKNRHRKNRRLRTVLRPRTDEELAAASKEDNSVPVLLKADVSGSLEVLQEYFAKLPRDEVLTSILRASLGEITAADVQFAASVDGGAAIVAFNVKASPEAVLLAKQLGIKIFAHSVIYSLWDDVRDLVSERLPTEMEEVSVGQATVAQLFPLTDVKEKRRKAKVLATAAPAPALVEGPLTPEEFQAQQIAEAERNADPVIAGCRVRLGKIDSKLHFRLRRGVPGEDEDQVIIAKAACMSLRVGKAVQQAVEKGGECGIRLGSPFDSTVKVGDIIECFEMRKKEKRVDDSEARGFMPDVGEGQSVHQQAASYE